MEMMNRDTADVAFEDDLYYAELKRQILILTADEEDGMIQEPVRPHQRNRSTGGLAISVQPWTHLNRWESEGCDSVPPAWLLRLWRNNGSGTGVFIPQIVKSTRKLRQGRMNKDKRRACKQWEKRLKS